jgi:catechol 2,3-dioxygenase-like lactoylglutathione lyase family enzyme
VAAAAKGDRAGVLERRAKPVDARCIDHVNISVSDLDASIEFYRSVLGAELKEQGGGEGTRWAILGARDRFYVCFFECRNGSFKENDVHINHVGFVVDDIDETVRRIHALGYRIEFNDAPLQWPRSRSAYLRDPDGILIEFTNRFGGGLD